MYSYFLDVDSSNTNLFYIYSMKLHQRYRFRATVIPSSLDYSLAFNTRLCSFSGLLFTTLNSPASSIWSLSSLDNPPNKAPFLIQRAVRLDDPRDANNDSFFGQHHYFLDRRDPSLARYYRPNESASVWSLPSHRRSVIFNARFLASSLRLWTLWHCRFDPFLRWQIHQTRHHFLFKKLFAWMTHVTPTTTLSSTSTIITIWMVANRPLTLPWLLKLACACSLASSWRL